MRAPFGVMGQIEYLRDLVHREEPSKDDPFDLEGETTREDTYAAPNPSPLEGALARERWALVRRAMRDRLTAKQRLVLCLHRGIPWPWRMEELAEALGVVRSRVYQLDASAVEKLRAALEQEREDEMRGRG